MFAVSFALASTPVYVALTVPQQQGTSERGAALAERQDPAPDLTVELARLRAELQQAREDLRAARQEVDDCLDLLEENTVRQRRHDCTPSRSMLTMFQWMDERGHGQRAERVLDRIVEEHGRDRARLNNVAWELMTDKETAGKYDRAALALVRQVLANGNQAHRHLDTAAMAFFLNGEVGEAVRLERQAVAQQQGNDDYRCRLRTYEAAQRLLPAKPETAAAKVAKAD